MRYVGIVIIFLLCVVIGLYMGQQGKKKILFYLDFKRIITLLKGEIRYGITPIGEACNHIANKTNGIFHDFLMDISVQIKKKSKHSFPEIWKSAAEKYLPAQFFTETEWNQMLQIGAALGCMDVKMQLRNLELMFEQVERSLAEARIHQEKDGKLYQTLGIGIGLMLVIVLI